MNSSVMNITQNKCCGAPYNLYPPPSKVMKHTRLLLVRVDVLYLVLSTIDTGRLLWKAVDISCMVPQNTQIVLCCVRNTAVQAKYSSSNYCDTL